MAFAFLFSGYEFNMITANTENVIHAASEEGEYNGILYSSNGSEITIVGYNDDINTSKLIIPDNIDGMPVTAIEGYSFCDIDTFSSIKIGRYVKRIGEHAFSGRGLKEITLSDSLIDSYYYIDEFFLTWYYSVPGYNKTLDLEKIIIPETVEEIPEFFFSDNFPFLTEFDVASGNKKYCSIDGVIYSKDKRTLIRFPSNKGITEFKVPDTVQTIEAGAFKGIKDQKINFFDLGCNVRFIGENAIADILEKTKEFKISSTITEYADEKMEDDDSSDCIFDYEKLLVSSSVKTLSPYFYSCDNHYGQRLKYIDVEKNNRFYRSDKGVLYSIEDEELLKYPCGNTSSSYKIMYGTKKIGKKSFQNTNNLKSLVIPSTVTTIAGSAFLDSAIDNIMGYSGSYAETFADDFGYTFTSLGEPVVSGKCNDNIKWVLNRESGVLEISGKGEMEDYGDDIGVYQPWEKYIDDISTVIINEGISSIGANAFYMYNNLTKVVLPDSIEKIGYGAFSNSFYLNDINIPNSIREVGVDAFYETEWLENQPDGIMYIGKALYTYKGNIPENTVIDIKDDTESITGYAFYDHINDTQKNIVKVSMPDTITELNGFTFNGCSGLTEIKLSDNIMKIGYCEFGGCSSLRKIQMPDKLTEIGELAFIGCTGFRSILIPENVEMIGIDAFLDCSDSLVFRAKENTYAEKYLTENNLKYRKLLNFSNSEVKGDINGDEIVSLRDFCYLADYIIYGEYKIDDNSFLDLNGDDKINSADILKLKELFL